MLIAHYKLDGNANDSSGNGYNGTASNLTYSTGKIGTAGSFNGTSSYFSFNNPLIQGSSFSISFWMKLNNITSIMNFGCCRTTVGEGISIFLITGGFIRFDTGASTPAYQWTTTYAPPANEWIHITLTKDSNYKKLYVNGIFHSSTNVVGDMATLYSLFTVGASQISGSNFANYTDGYIDDYRIYNHALSQKEIKELSRAKVLHYDFDDFQEPTTNLISNPNDFNYWTGNLFNNWVNLSVTSDQAEAPDKTLTADKLSGDGYSLFTSSISIIPSTSYTCSVYIRTGTLTNGFYLYYAWGLNGSLVYYDSSSWVSINDTWVRYSFTITAPSSGVNQLQFGIAPHIGTGTNPSGTYLYAWGGQVEQKDHATPFVNGTRTGVVRDISGYNNDATLALATTPQWTEDSKMGEGCYKFNGALNYIDTGSKLLNDNLPFTYSAWIKFSVSQTGKTILGRHANSPGGASIGIDDTAANKIKFHLNNYSTQRINSTMTLNDNTWHHVVGTWDGTTLKLYVDSVLDASATPSTTLTFADLNTQIGRWVGGASQYFQGDIDDVRIYATALNSADILELYQTRAQIDKNGNMFAINFEEADDAAIQTSSSETLPFESTFFLEDIYN